MSFPYSVLADEINADPLSRGYAAMSDQEVADDINTVYRTRNLERLDQTTVYNNVDITEFLALNNTQRAEVWDIVHVGGGFGADGGEPGLWVRPGDTARERFVTLFGAGSATITALAAELVVNISRAEELGLPFVKAPHVNEARAMVR